MIAEIRQAFLDHLVVFFRDQKLTPPEQLAFAKRFGEPMEYPQLKGLPECPLITPGGQARRTSGSTSAGCGIPTRPTSPQPPMASMLYALEIPPYGGDTIFANQYPAYETLSEGLQQTLDGLIGVNTSTKADASKTREDAAEGGRRRDEGADGRASGGAHPSRNRAARRSTSITATPRISRAGRRRRAAPLLEYLWQPPGAARIHLPLPVAARLARLLGQPLRPAQCGQRLRGLRRIMHRVTLAGDTPR